MKSSHHPTAICRNILTTGVLGCLLAGCSVVGPSAIRSGRHAYNEAITETNNQQMLLVAIHNRYDETGSLLAVASVTANVRAATTTGIQLGFGDNDNYAGNLVPFSAGAVYEENPTISYTPVAGAKYMRRLFSPVPLSTVAQIAGTLSDPSYIYSTLVSSVNDIQNPDFLFATEEPDPRFSRFVSIMVELTQAHRLHWVDDPQQGDSLSIVIERYAPTYLAEVSELLGLLGLPMPHDGSARLVLPVSLALYGRNTSGISMTTRSLFDLVEIMSAAVEVPEQDQHNGATANYPPAGLVGKDLRLRRADARPKHAYVAVQHRDDWYYIDETDRATKRFFMLLSSLWSVTIAESAAGSPAPVLTIPVSR